MASIEQQIRDAVPQQLERAAQFNDTKTRDDVEVWHLVIDILQDAQEVQTEVFHAEGRNRPLDVEMMRRKTLDQMNRHALVLSLLPETEEADGGK